MTVVIKFTVVGLQGFDAERVREPVSAKQNSVLCGKECIVFSYAAIIVGFLPIYADIPNMMQRLPEALTT